MSAPTLAPAPVAKESGNVLNLNTSFDTATSMFALFLWLVFGFLSPHMVNCDVQRFIANNGYVRLVTGLVAFFFLFTLIDSGSAEVTVITILVKTVLVYALFIGFTKSKWYFALPVILLLSASMLVKRAFDVRIRRLEESAGEEKAARLRRAARITDTSINVTIVALIVVGMLQYMGLQKIEYGEAFSVRRFFLETNRHCKPKGLDYRLLASKESR